jgi:hypothetical protein
MPFFQKTFKKYQKLLFLDRVYNRPFYFAGESDSHGSVCCGTRMRGFFDTFKKRLAASHLRIMAGTVRGVLASPHE